MLIFQFTLPREERRQVQAQPLTLQNFNPRSHERSDHITQSFVFRFFNFNPRSHERSDSASSTIIEKASKISIHAPTRGATQSPCMFLQGSCYFNPRSHERSDDVSCNPVLKVCISIHAPTRGATYPFCLPDNLIHTFQSTLPREERPLTAFLYDRDDIFQSTLPREERHWIS